MGDEELEAVKGLIRKYCAEAIGQYVENVTKRGRVGHEAVSHALEHVMKKFDAEVGASGGVMAAKHVVQFVRFRRGLTPTRPQRPLYGYWVLCSCGYKLRLNATKAEAKSYAKEHKKTSP